MNPAPPVIRRFIRRKEYHRIPARFHPGRDADRVARMSTSPARESDRIRGVYIVPLRAFADDRGYFFESFRKTWVPGVAEMIQGNVSFSKAGVLRGLHYHLKQADFWLVPSDTCARRCTTCARR